MACEVCRCRIYDLWEESAVTLRLLVSIRAEAVAPRVKRREDAAKAENLGTSGRLNWDVREVMGEP